MAIRNRLAARFFRLLVALVSITIILYVVHTASSSEASARSKLKTVGTEIALQFLVCIFSAPLNFDRRSAMRQSWLSARWRYRYNFEYFFLLGKPVGLSDNDTELLRLEKLRFNDIVQVSSFDDHYQQLSSKLLAMLQQAKQKYAEMQFNYVLKVDDDTFINMPYYYSSVENLTRSNQVRGKLIAGHIEVNALPDRGEGRKYFVPYELFNATELPPYVRGPAYLIGYPAVNKLTSVVQVAPYINLEDVYLALLAEKANVKLMNIGLTIRQGRSWCELDGHGIAHPIEPEVMQAIWKQYTDYMDLGESVPCRPSTFRGPLALYASVLGIILFISFLSCAILSFCIIQSLRCRELFGLREAVH